MAGNVRVYNSLLISSQFGSISLGLWILMYKKTSFLFAHFFQTEFMKSKTTLVSFFSIDFARAVID